MKNSIIIIMGSLGAFLALSVYKTIETKNRLVNSFSNLPSVSFITLNNEIFAIEDISGRHKIIINYFNPECEHCQYMATSFVKNAAGFKIFRC